MIRIGLRSHLFERPWRRRGFLIFALATAFSLAANLLSNHRPLLVSDPRSSLTVFPFLEFQAGSVFQQPQATEADYALLENEPGFRGAGGMVIWAPMRWGPIVSDPSVNSPPSAPAEGHPLGTDDRGRDVFSRLLYGFRTSLFFAVLATLLIALIGSAFGAVQGYCGGFIDLFLQRVIEALRAFPVLYLLVFVGAILAPGFWVALIVWVLIAWIPFGQYVRAEILRAREMPYVTSTRLLGYGAGRILIYHIFPNVFPRLVALLPFTIFNALVTLAAVDFLGVGLAPPEPSIGELLHQAMENQRAWWLILFPGCVLAGVLFFTQMVAEVLRESME